MLNQGSLTPLPLESACISYSSGPMVQHLYIASQCSIHHNLVPIYRSWSMNKAGMYGRLWCNALCHKCWTIGPLQRQRLILSIVSKHSQFEICVSSPECVLWQGLFYWRDCFNLCIFCPSSFQAWLGLLFGEADNISKASLVEWERQVCVR